MLEMVTRGSAAIRSSSKLYKLIDWAVSDSLRMGGQCKPSHPHMRKTPRTMRTVHRPSTLDGASRWDALDLLSTSLVYDKQHYTSLCKFDDEASDQRVKAALSKFQCHTNSIERYDSDIDSPIRTIYAERDSSHMDLHTIPSDGDCTDTLGLVNSIMGGESLLDAANRASSSTSGATALVLRSTNVKERLAELEPFSKYIALGQRMVIRSSISPHEKLEKWPVPVLDEAILHPDTSDDAEEGDLLLRGWFRSACSTEQHPEGKNGEHWPCPSKTSNNSPFYYLACHDSSNRTSFCLRRSRKQGAVRHADNNGSDNNMVYATIALFCQSPNCIAAAAKNHTKSTYWTRCLVDNRVFMTTTTTTT